MLRKYFKRFSPNPKTRRKAIWRGVQRKAQRHGFEVYKSHLSWIYEPEFRGVFQQWEKTRLPGMPADRAFFLYAAARSIRSVAGDTADVGVRYGSSSFYILNGLADNTREHHLFDSFEGLSAPLLADNNAHGQLTRSKGAMAAEEEVTRQNLSSFSHCHYYKGWIPARFSEVQHKKFALVHIDVNLYQPTLDSLIFFYDRMSPGGVIICDDYGFPTCPGATKAFDEFFVGKEPVFNIPTGQCLVVKR